MWIGLAAFGWLPGSTACDAAQAPRVVASIVPLHALVATVMAGVGEPRLLVPPGASPHAFALRPSDAAALESADLIVWIGPDFERFLTQPIANLGSNATTLTLAQEPSIATLPAREGGVWPGHGDDDHDDHHGAIDGHLWLDPHNAQAIVAVVAAALADLDPGHGELYRANAETAIGDLKTLDGELDRALAPVRERPFVVFHDAYQYLEARYNLRAVGAITVDPEHPPSAGHLKELQDALATLGVVCVFAEPQFGTGLVDALMDGTEIGTAVLDPLGRSPGPGAYIATLKSLGAALGSCLAGSP